VMRFNLLLDASARSSLSWAHSSIRPTLHNRLSVNSRRMNKRAKVGGGVSSFSPFAIRSRRIRSAPDR
jgi:hypothetical protein